MGVTNCMKVVPHLANIKLLVSYFVIWSSFVNLAKAWYNRSLSQCPKPTQPLTEVHKATCRAKQEHYPANWHKISTYPVTCQKTKRKEKRNKKRNKINKHFSSTSQNVNFAINVWQCWLICAAYCLEFKKLQIITIARIQNIVCLSLLLRNSRHPS